MFFKISTANALCFGQNMQQKEFRFNHRKRREGTDFMAECKHKNIHLKTDLAI